jgi:hypothetical protein
LITDEFTKFLIDSDYFVKLRKLKDRFGCIVTFPSLGLYEDDYPKLSLEYAIESDTVAVTNVNDNQLIRVVQTIRYIIRPLIIFDISTKSVLSAIQPDCILAFDEDDKFTGGLSDVNCITYDLDENETAKEKKIISIMHDICFDSKFEYPEDIKDGCKEFVRILESGLKV